MLINWWRHRPGGAADLPELFVTTDKRAGDDSSPPAARSCTAGEDGGTPGRPVAGEREENTEKARLGGCGGDGFLLDGGGGDGHSLDIERQLSATQPIESGRDSAGVHYGQTFSSRGRGGNGGGGEPAADESHEGAPTLLQVSGCESFVPGSGFLSHIGAWRAQRIPDELADLGPVLVQYAASEPRESARVRAHGHAIGRGGDELEWPFDDALLESG